MLVITYTYTVQYNLQNYKKTFLSVFRNAIFPLTKFRQKNLIDGSQLNECKKNVLIYAIDLIVCWNAARYIKIPGK